MAIAATRRRTESKATGPYYKSASSSATRDRTPPTDSPLIYRQTSCACGGGCPACQAKSDGLRISQPNDPAEIEADQIADKVMRLHVRDGKLVASGENSGKAIHRECDACETEGEEKIPERAMRKEAFASAAPDPPPPDEVPTSIRNVLNSGGQPLDCETRSFFEPRLGVDLSAVRVHTDVNAAGSAREMNALAFTVGRNVVFGAGQYAPGTTEGQKLLAHELTHTIQQSSLAVARSTAHTKYVKASSLEIAQPVTHTLQRQHDPGGPYHPPEGTSLRCTITDSCSTLSLKINYLRHTIRRHIEWDIANPMPDYPGGRHAQEIAELQNALANCIEQHQRRCTRQPEVVPVPVPDPAAVRRVATATAVGAGIGMVAGAVLGALGGGAGGTLVAPGVGTIGGGVAGGVAGATEGAAIGGLAGGAVMGGAQALWEWLSK
jgi:hypothetical protein